MHKGALIHRATVVCPICKLDDFVVNRRMPGIPHGTVEKQCLCQRCGAVFIYAEDRLGRPMKK